MSISEEEIKESFEIFDANNDGVITQGDVKKVLEALGMDASQSEVDEVLSSADINGDGMIIYEEFKKHILEKSQS